MSTSTSESTGSTPSSRESSTSPGRRHGPCRGAATMSIHIDRVSATPVAAASRRAVDGVPLTTPASTVGLPGRSRERPVPRRPATHPLRQASDHWSPSTTTAARLRARGGREAVRRRRPSGLLGPQTLPCRLLLRRGGLGPLRADLPASRVLPDPHRGRDPPRPRRRDGGRLARAPDPDRAGQRQRREDPAADRGGALAITAASITCRSTSRTVPSRRRPRQLVRAFPALRVTGLRGRLPRQPRRRSPRGSGGRSSVVFLGSSLGNYEPEAAAGLLGTRRPRDGPGRPASCSAPTWPRTPRSWNPPTTTPRA